MHKIRVIYSKTGDIKYISHLDMNRFMARAIRRANIDVIYTEGFNPHPYIDFALPLSLGFESNYECMDIKIEDDIDFSTIKEKLALAMPLGIKIISVNHAVNKSSKISFAEFIIEFENLDDIEQNIINTLNQSEINTTKTTKKGKIKTVNIKEFIKEFDIKKNKASVILNITLAAGSEKNINPNLLVSFLKEKNENIKLKKIVRNKLFLIDGSVFV